MPNTVPNEQGLVMKVTMRRDPLIQHVNRVMKAVSSQTTIPILTGLKMTASAEETIFTGSDGNMTIESTMTVDKEEENLIVEKSGSIVLPGQFFAELIKKLPEDHIEIKVDERFSITICSGDAEFDLNGMDAEEYPHLPEITATESFRIKADTLKTIIRQTAFAVSTSETQPVLTGTNWQIQDGMMTCVATDGHRLAMRKADMEDNTENLDSLVIPGKSLNELGKIIDDHTEWIDFTVTENQVLFKTGQLQFFSRLLNNNYPETSRLIPTETKTEIIVHTKTFTQALERTWLLAREDRNHVVKLSITSHEDIEISSHSPELGKVFDKIKAQSMDGEEIKISFSAKLMIAALRAIDADEVSVRFTGAMRPFVIQPINDDTVLQLVLPVRSY